MRAIYFIAVAVLLPFHVNSTKNRPKTPAFFQPTVDEQRPGHSNLLFKRSALHELLDDSSCKLDHLSVVNLHTLGSGLIAHNAACEGRMETGSLTREEATRLKQHTDGKEVIGRCPHRVQIVLCRSRNSQMKYGVLTRECLSPISACAKDASCMPIHLFHGRRKIDDCLCVKDAEPVVGAIITPPTRMS